MKTKKLTIEQMIEGGMWLSILLFIAGFMKLSFVLVALAVIIWTYYFSRLCAELI